MTELAHSLNWIAVDWGTSSLRVWAIDASGEVLASASSADGMATLTREQYEPTLLRLVSDWLTGIDAPVPVIVCGMAGAKTGWAEAGYRTVPCTPVGQGEFTSVETTDPRISVSIVPGLCQSHPADVMRGEETQLAGLLAETNGADALLCMPGTHSKWVSLQGGKVSVFQTFMTGELFASISKHTILRFAVDTDQFDDQVMLASVKEIVERPESFSSKLFSIRASALLDDLDSAAARARLSGYLIGLELAANASEWRTKKVHLVGDNSLVSSYHKAIEHMGGRAVIHDVASLTRAGLAQVHQNRSAEI